MIDNLPFVWQANPAANKRLVVRGSANLPKNKEIGVKTGVGAGVGIGKGVMEKQTSMSNIPRDFKDDDEEEVEDIYNIVRGDDEYRYSPS